MRETRVRSLGREDLLEKEMATHSSVLAWEIPWTQEPGLQSVVILQATILEWLKLRGDSIFCQQSACTESEEKVMKSVGG